MQIVVDPDVLALYPLALVVDGKLVFLLGVVVDQMAQRVSSVTFNASFALHVGLADHEVDFHWRLRLS